MAFRWTTVLGVVLLQGCGGRAQSDGGVPEPPADGPSAIAGAINDGSTAGSNHDGAGGKAGSGTASAGGGSTINPIDDESHASGAPVALGSAAIFWGSPAGGWNLGNWFWSSDRVRDVELSPIEPPRDGSKQARHVSGAGFPSGVVLWFELDHPQRRPVDLSPYAGLTFWTRLSSTSGKLDVLLNDGSTVTAWGESPPASSLSVAVGGGWQQVTLSFEDFGVPQPQAVSIDFHVGDGGGSFDLWIDDLAFFCAGPCP